MPVKGSGLAEYVNNKYNMSLGEYLNHLYWEKGFSQMEICKELNLSTGYMSRLFKKHNIPKRKMGYWLPDRVKTIGKVKIGLDYHLITGRNSNKAGYVLLTIKTHPNASKTGKVMEHRVLMEQQLGRYLDKQEVVHHKNEIKYDNRIENLVVMDRGKHVSLHHVGSRRNEETRGKMSQKAQERWGTPNFSKEEMIELIKSNKTLRCIFKETGIHQSTYYKKVEELGLQNIHNQFRGRKNA